jgi:NAD(P)-dependent dehydrogenase (short-subunit alcohol dehydrogenase family)
MLEEVFEMNSKVCLVTGGTSGIGWETAKYLTGKGAQVVIVGRNSQRGTKAVTSIRQINPEAQIEFMGADLSSMDSVRALATNFRERTSRLDVLVNNAGTFLLFRKVSADGYEMTLAANHLGHFLLTRLLEDLLRASASARVINVSSESHRNAQINFDDLHGERGYNGMRAYGQSKLANVLFTYELSRRFAGNGYTANAVQPGFVSTNLGRDNGWLIHKLTRLFMLTGKSAEAGAKTLNYLASSPEVSEVSGKYFGNNKPVTTSTISYDRPTAERFWSLSEELTGLNR